MERYQKCTAQQKMSCLDNPQVICSPSEVHCSPPLVSHCEALEIKPRLQGVKALKSLMIPIATKKKTQRINKMCFLPNRNTQTKPTLHHPVIQKRNAK